MISPSAVRNSPATFRLSARCSSGWPEFRAFAASYYVNMHNKLVECYRYRHEITGALDRGNGAV